MANWGLTSGVLVVCAVALAATHVARAEDKSPGESFRDHLANGQSCLDCPEMVVIPAGTFLMGSPASEDGHFGNNREDPQHAVTIPKPFAIGKFEVTFKEWDACVSAGECERSSRYIIRLIGDGKAPVAGVSWNEVTTKYLPWLSRKTGKVYRLPSEAEWEYAARAGSTTPFWWGASISSDQANYNGDFTYAGGLKGEYRRQTVSVDSFAANPWGLYNVHGNVSEFVQDCWHDGYNGAPSDGSAWISRDCRSHVHRGGSYANVPSFLRSASRKVDTPSSPETGFRLARTLDP